ncbi:MAG: heparinase II/III family protein, partial [Bacteroidetes bacterium]|nr:heparinase II/III family protein [Bacteroidota bacterium]
TLWNLVMAESAEGRGRFTEQIMNGVWSICEESYWGIAAHVGIQKAGKGLPDVEEPTVDLFAAETASVMAWTDYFAGAALDKISPLIRKRIYYETNRRVLAPMLKAKYGYLGNGRTDAKLNNWAPWVMSNYITASLLLEKDQATRARYCSLAMHYVDQYINGLGEDGGCDEGPGYWNAAGACVFDALNILSDASAGKINIYHHPFIRKMGAYIYKTHIAGRYYINVADAHPEITPNPLMLFRFGQAMGDTTMMAFGSWVLHTYPSGNTFYETFFRTRGLFDQLALNACTQYPAREPKEADAWFDDVQLMAARSAHLFLAGHGGNNGESHNHNDVGDFIVYADGYPVIIDVGSGTYTARTFGSERYSLWFNTSAYHNLPVVNGYQQKEGAAFAATAVQYQPGAPSTRLSMDIAKAWPAAAGIQSWQRTLTLDRKDVIRITDQFSLNTPVKSITQSFMTVADASADRPGVIVFTLPNGKTVNLLYDAARWQASKEKMMLTSPEDQGLIHGWHEHDIYRILLTAKAPAAKGTFTYTIR